MGVCASLLIGFGTALCGKLVGDGISSASQNMRSGVENAAQTLSNSLDRNTLEASDALRASTTELCGAIAQVGRSSVTAAAVLGNYHLNAAIVLAHSARQVEDAIRQGAQALDGVGQAIVQAQQALEANMADALIGAVNLAGKWMITIVVLIALGWEFRFGQGIPITRLAIATAFSFPHCLVPLFAFTWGFVYAICVNLSYYFKLINATQDLKLRALHPSLVVPGTVFAYAGEILPVGYLWCNGDLHPVAKYRALHDAILNAHGSSGDGLKFRVPDYRGRFLRGVDDAISNRDPDRNSREVMKDGGNFGARVGSIQPCATRVPAVPFIIDGETNTNGTHRHPTRTVWAAGAMEHQGFICFATSYKNDPEGRHKSVDQDDAGNHDHRVTGSVNGGGDAETRPCNAYVNYIIKF